MLNGSVGLEQLARDILPVVGDVQDETIMGIANRLVEAAIKRLQMGCAVNFGICHARPSVSGPFYGKDPRFNPEINSISVNISVTRSVREAMKSVPVEMAGVAQTSPVINYVTDVKTGEMNGGLTPDLSAGEWYVEVVTQHSSSGKTVKEPRTYRFEQVLTVVSKG